MTEADDELADILKDLEEAKSEAREEGFPEPSAAAKTNAEGLVLKMHAFCPRRFEVYPTPNGEIAVDIPCGRGKSVVLFCDSRGEILCTINKNGEHRRARFHGATAEAEGFVREALADMDR